MNERISELKNKLKTEEKHDFESLRQLVEVLRSEDGCPWDREQTHASIRTDLIEETYEAIEGIDKDDMVLLQEELGDVLFQVIFHSRIEEEKGGFTVDEVINDICHKMIIRHPHVFGSVEVDSSAQVLKNWEAIKTVEKSRDTAKSKMEAVPKQYPALIRAKKVIKKARAAGFDFGTDGDLTAQLTDLTASLANADEETRQKLLTEIIFTSVQLAGNDADVEKSLGDRVTDFIENYPEEE
ncbi:MAG: MazG family protein [Clostridia bacterium]|nr:MazG family protein [Clostridia bacterium]